MRQRTMRRAREREDNQGFVEETTTIGRIKLVAGIVALGALVTFCLQNLQEVQVHFLWFDWETRLLWALLASGAFGGVGLLAFGTLTRRRRDEDRQ